MSRSLDYWIRISDILLASLSWSYLVCVCVVVVVTIGMCKYEEQNALAGFCCFNAVTSLVTAGHRTGLIVAAGAGFASAIAARAISRIEIIMLVTGRRLAIRKRRRSRTVSKRGLNHVYTSLGRGPRAGHTTAFCVLFETSPPGSRYRLESSSRWSLSSHGEKRLASRLHNEWLE